MLTESWIITGKCEAGVSAIIKDAFEQYRRLEFNKLKPKVDKPNHYEVEHTENPNTPRIRLVSLGNGNIKSSVSKDIARIELHGQCDQFLIQFEEFLWKKQTSATDISKYWQTTNFWHLNNEETIYASSPFYCIMGLRDRKPCELHKTKRIFIIKFKMSLFYNALFC